MTGPKSLVLVPFGPPGVGPLKYLQPALPGETPLPGTNSAWHEKIRVARRNIQRLDGEQHCLWGCSH